MLITNLPMFLQHHKEDIMSNARKSIMESTDSYAMTFGINVFKHHPEEEEQTSDHCAGGLSIMLMHFPFTSRVLGAYL
ncbi:hypothetical protein H6P81_001468 [Aristolochia fimbriata]|uniref:Uncharacterized protein n=1 Tax=Aristolochia fimbriata TaxID=158543 RepID=A0AAV7F6Z0_ARIFI|nr:hypothetical protein H6P81_001468 [Aristolochia fimbriata]